MPALGEHRRSFYPGLIPIETALWRRWLLEHEGEFDRFEYNVHVGKGVNVPDRPVAEDPELDRRLKEMFRGLTQKKIDVVGHAGPQRTIFEVEERPGTRALGQMLTYRELLSEQRPPLAPDRLVLVARRLGTDMRSVFERQEVEIFLVEPLELGA